MNAKKLNYVLGVIAVIAVGTAAYIFFADNKATDNTNLLQSNNANANTGEEMSNSNANANTETTPPANKPNNGNSNVNSNVDDKMSPAPSQYKISGTFNIYFEGMMSEMVWFKTTTATGAFAKGTEFVFKNQPEARSGLKIDQAGTLGKNNCGHISGAADVTVSNYTLALPDTDSANVATLVKVDKITQAAKCGAGQGF